MNKALWRNRNDWWARSARTDPQRNQSTDVSDLDSQPPCTSRHGPLKFNPRYEKNRSHAIEHQSIHQTSCLANSTHGKIIRFLNEDKLRFFGWISFIYW